MFKKYPEFFKSLPFVVIALLFVVVFGMISGEESVKTPIGQGSGWVAYDAPSYLATTTAPSSSLPLKVLPRDTNRIRAEITNNDGTNVAYLYIGEFDSAVAASTTVVVNAGVRLDPKETYVIDDSNWFPDTVWASSTAATQLLVVYK